MEETKEVTYRGKKYTVPEWTRYMATDMDGAMYAYERSPTEGCDCWWEDKGRSKNVEYPVRWEDSLEEV